jgi:hypothetical protein
MTFTPEPAMRIVVGLWFMTMLVGCNRAGKERELAECVSIYRTAYVSGQVRDCLVNRYGWSAEDADEAERKELGATSPDSSRQADSGRIGDSVKR